MSARIARAECFFGATGATLAHGGNRASYRPSTDSIVLPLFEAFRDAESYYATLAHETTHYADTGIMPRRSHYPRHVLGVEAWRCGIKSDARLVGLSRFRKRHHLYPSPDWQVFSSLFSGSSDSAGSSSQPVDDPADERGARQRQ
jgi:hypothetical protein